VYERLSTSNTQRGRPQTKKWFRKKALEQYAVENGLSLAKFYVDDAISGNSTLGRRAFKQMIEDAQKTNKSFDKVIVLRIRVGL